MSFLSDDDDDDVDASWTFKSQIYEQLSRDMSGDGPTATSGYVETPANVSATQPMFLIIDYCEQILPTGYVEKVIRLWPGIGHDERFVHLRGSWTRTNMSISDPVFIVGTWVRRTDPHGIYEDKLSAVVDDKDGFFVLLPHVLIQGTQLAESQDCERKAFLRDLLPAGGSSDVFLRGIMVHELIQAILFGLSADDLEVKLDNLLDTETYTLFTIGHTRESFKEKLNEYMPLIRAIGEGFVKGQGSEPENLEQPGMVVPIERLPPYGCECLREEENLWSFQWGVKGKVDVTLRYGERMLPLELKSGSCTSSPHVSHVLQLSAYIFMMKEKYGEKAGSSGTLFYAKTNTSFKVEPRRLELMHIIIKRNRLAHAICHGAVPQTSTESRSCRFRDYIFCGGLAACAFLEDGEIEKSPINTEIMRNLSYRPKPHHREFYEKWNDRLLEESACARSTQVMIWMTPMSRRVDMGCAISGLTAEFYMGSIIKFHGSQRAIRKANMNQRNYVMFTRNGVPPIVGRGVIDRFDDDVILVEMIEVGLSDGETEICMDLWEGTTSVDICRSNLMSLFSDSHEQGTCRLRELIVDMEAPVFDPLPPVESIVSTGLNDDQSTAIRTACSARDYMLLLGMPGTGKTTTLAMMIRTLAERGEKILIASFTHTAVDNLCRKLMDLNVDFIRIGRLDAIDEHVRPHTLETIINNAETVEDISRRVDSCQIFASTCLGFHHPLISSRIYDTCVIDEASQISVPQVLGPLSRARRFILVGDHYQLPPIRPQGSGLRTESVSLFRMLCEAHPHVIVTLRTQYRMNDEILRLCNRLVYDFRMRTGSREVEKTRISLPRIEILDTFYPFHKNWLDPVIDPGRPIIVANTDSAEMHESSGSSSKYNNGEAAICAAIVTTMVLCGMPPARIGVISPYRAQVERVVHAILKFLYAAQSCYPHIITSVEDVANAIRCHTVDKFQGQDKEVIIFTSVKSNVRFKPGNHITDWQRLNVAVTRAKSKFILVGSVLTLSNSPFLSGMLDVAGSSSILHLPREVNYVNAAPFGAMSLIADPPMGT